MKDETKWFIEKRIADLVKHIQSIECVPKMDRTSYQMDSLKNSKTELSAYSRIIRMEYEGQIPYGYEKE